jgi:hypothetical protein
MIDTPSRELDYAPARRALLGARRGRALVAAAILLALGILGFQYGERAYRAAELWYYERRAMTYTMPPDFLVYESDPEKLPSYGRKRYVHSLHAGAPAWPWDAIRGYDFGETVLFLHGRTAPGGTPKRVCVYLPSGHFKGWNASTGVHGLRFALRYDVAGKDDGVAAGLDIPGWSGDAAADPHYLRFFAGQPDPNDASRFTIRYELDGVGQGTIEGLLQPDDTVKLTIHPPPPTTQPR